MRDRLLSGLVFLMLFGLGLILYISDRSISRFMESCGSLISEGFGL